MYNILMDLGLSFKEAERFLLYLDTMISKNTLFQEERHETFKELLKQVKDYEK